MSRDNGKPPSGMAVILDREDVNAEMTDPTQWRDYEKSTDADLSTLSTSFAQMPSPSRVCSRAALQKPPCHDSSHGGRSNTSEVANNPSDTTSTNNVPRTSDKEGVAYKACTGLLQERVLDELSLLTKTWKGSIVLSCVPMTALEGVDKAKEEPVDIDICDYLSGQKAQYSRLNFSPCEFPPPVDLKLAFKKKNNTWNKLKTYIVKQSYKARSPVVCSSSSAGEGGKKFVCQTLNDTNEKNKGRKREDEDFRETHLVNDGERGERENGRSDGKCGLLFTVKCDEIGYHITLFRSAGTCMHSHHIKYNYSDVSLPLRLLEKNEFKELKNVHDTQAGEGICKAYLFAKTGQLVPRGKIAYLFGSKATGDADFASDVDKLLSYLEDEKDIVHAVFWDMASRGNDGCRLVSKCKCVEDEDPIVTDLTADRSMKKVVAMVREDRKERNIGSNQNLFLSVMWGEKGNYSALMPQFNDVCRVCEQFPQLRQKLSEAHEDILKHGRKLASEKMSNPERNGATVSMLTDRHTGPSRVYNTKINPI